MKAAYDVKTAHQSGFEEPQLLYGVSRAKIELQTSAIRDFGTVGGV
jgi:hypothetical protein